MRELEGRSYPEIADTLGVTVSAVEALIARSESDAASVRGVPRRHADPASALAPWSARAGERGRTCQSGDGIVAGVVATTAGSAPALNAQKTSQRAVTPRVETRHHATPPSVSTHLRSSTKSAQLGGPASAVVLPRRSSYSIDVVASTAPAAPAPAPAAEPPAPSSPPALPPSLPDLPSPPLELPQLPDLPPLPEPPSPPTLPLP
jgi:hypothetical protein